VNTARTQCAHDIPEIRTRVIMRESYPTAIRPVAKRGRQVP
jgi:hypothetical protein